MATYRKNAVSVDNVNHCIDSIIILQLNKTNNSLQLNSGVSVNTIVDDMSNTNSTSLITGIAVKNYIDNLTPFSDTVTTTNDTFTTIKTINTTTGTFYSISTTIAGKNTTNGTDFGLYVFKFGIKNIADTITITNSSTETVSEDDENWDIAATISGTNVLIQVKGITANNINWTARTLIQTL